LLHRRRFGRALRAQPAHHHPRRGHGAHRGERGG